MTTPGLIHVAGVIDDAEAEMLIDCGVTHLGFPLVLGYHAEDLGVTDAARIVTRHGQRATFFLITHLDDAGAIRDLCRELDVTMVQLHGDIAHSELVKLRTEAPELQVIRSLIVREDNQETLIAEAAVQGLHVDAFITDTFDPVTGATGATGKTHDWTVSRCLLERSPKPVILAGGLSPGNVREAIGSVRPAGVDVHTGVEGDDGRKRRDLVEQFAREAMAGFAEIGRSAS